MKKNLLAVGDVLRTHPFDGYWGCALVLSACDEPPGLGSSCHIGITSTVLTHEYQFEELKNHPLEILDSNRTVRVAPYTSVRDGQVTCIGIYSRKPNPDVPVIGRMDTSSVYSTALEFKAGNGKDGGWPLCGTIDGKLGFEAVHAWRAQHDRDNWLAEVNAAEREFEEMLIRLKAEEKQKRKKRSR